MFKLHGSKTLMKYEPNINDFNNLMDAADVDIEVKLKDWYSDLKKLYNRYIVN